MRSLKALLLVHVVSSQLPFSASASSLWTSWLKSDEGNSVKDASQQEDDLQLVSPIINRELQARVVAHAWPTTVHSVVCEAMIYFDSSPLFLQRLATQLLLQKEDEDEEDDSSEPLSYEQATKHILQASLLNQTALLELHLAMRAASPHCEMHRTVARQLLLESHPHLDATSMSQINVVMAIVQQPNKVQQVLVGEAAIQSFDYDSSSSFIAGASSYSEADISTTLLHGEHLYRKDTPSKTVLIVYANLGSKEFARVYQYLLQSTSLPFVVRHLGAVYFEDLPESTAATNPMIQHTALQGYGVRLDIRNVEYKVFDDRVEHKDDGESSLRALVNLSDAQLTMPVDFLAGVNASALNIVDTDMNTLQAKLWKQHEQQQRTSQIVPPAWQRRQLPLQMTTVISKHSKNDPLLALEELSQNLPSVASTLVHVKIDEGVLEMATKLDEINTLKSGKLYVNGRVIHFDRPSFNVFELLDIMKEEEAALHQMQQQLGAYLTMEELTLLQDAWIMGDAFLKGATTDDASDVAATTTKDVDTVYRVDVARGGKLAVLYLNDVEKDRAYQQWPRSVKKMLMNMQYGMPPMVRRNLFTVLAVMDPVSRTDNVGLDLALQVMQSSFPIRIGILLVNEQDVQTCAEWLTSNTVEEGTPCPTSSVLSGTPSLDDLKNMKATTHAFYKLFSSFLTGDRKEAGGGAAYLDFCASQLQDLLDTQGEITLYDLVYIHGDLMEGVGVAAAMDAQKEALKTLLQTDSSEDKDVDHASYGHALRFAAEKGVKPGMSFLNGRALPLEREQAEGVSAMFGEEQRYVFGMIVSGDITDTSPKSVYGHILTGDKVFKRFHPLLVAGGDDADSYAAPGHTFDNNSLLQPLSESSSGPAFVVEGVFDFNIAGAAGQALAFLDVLGDFPKALSSGKEMKMQFRLIAKVQSDEDALKCGILSIASRLSIPVLRSVLARLEGTPSLANLLEDLDVPDDLRLMIETNAKTDICLNKVYSDVSLPTAFMIANGRVFPIETGSVPTREDVDLLLTMEFRRAKAVSELVKDASIEAISRAASFLALSESSTTRTHTDKSLAMSTLGDSWTSNDNPLRLVWKATESFTLAMHVCAVVDPATTYAQRLSTMLRLIQNQLDVDLTLILRPELLIGGDSKVPISSYYRFVAGGKLPSLEKSPQAYFSNLPTNHILTLQIDVAEPWNVQQSAVVQDTDNLRCDVQSGCSDEAYAGTDLSAIPLHEQKHLTKVEYNLKSLLIFGQCYEVVGGPPSGLQLALSRQVSGLEDSSSLGNEVDMEGNLVMTENRAPTHTEVHSDTLVMKNVGYWQLQAGPGLWDLQIAADTKGADIFDIVDGTFKHGRLVVNSKPKSDGRKKTIAMQDFVNKGELLIVKRRPGHAKTSLFDENDLSLPTGGEDDVIHVFSLATGHLYERFLKIMMLSVTKRTSSKVKFWLFENFLSPSFKSSAQYMAAQIGSEVEFVTYKWPEWLRGQSEKQRIIWGYKILFLDVLFPLNVKKIIYVDADQVLRGDLKELWDMDLEKKPYGYTPFCTSRETTLGYQFWRDGFWKQHLRGRPYHISALYVVDLERFRKTHVGDTLRAVYQQLSADPNSLANLDQDLPNYAQHQVPIFSLPQEWLWCESWCSDETKAASKTIDLCNNPLHKEPKVSMAKRVISGPLFNESWIELDAEVDDYDKSFQRSIIDAVV